jgi:hypothetical protein
MQYRRITELTEEPVNSKSLDRPPTLQVEDGYISTDVPKAIDPLIPSSYAEPGSVGKSLCDEVREFRRVLSVVRPRVIQRYFRSIIKRQLSELISGFECDTLNTIEREIRTLFNRELRPAEISKLDEKNYATDLLQIWEEEFQVVKL